MLLAQTLALELAEQRINVNVVSPGFIEVGLRPGVSIPYREKIKHDIPWGFSAQDTAAGAKWIERGIRWMPYSNDVNALFNTFSTAASELKKSAGR